MEMGGLPFRRRGVLLFDEAFVGLLEPRLGDEGAPALKDASKAVFFSSLACLCGCDLGRKK